MAIKKTRITTPASTPSAQVTPAAPAAAPARSEIKGSGTAPKAGVRAITHCEIAQRAYEIYAGRGYAAGSPEEDWREAERQLRAGL